MWGSLSRARMAGQRDGYTTTTYRGGETGGKRFIGGGGLYRVEGCISDGASEIKGGYDFGYDFVVGIYRCILILYDDMICYNYDIDVDNTNFWWMFSTCEENLCFFWGGDILSTWLNLFNWNPPKKTWILMQGPNSWGFFANSFWVADNPKDNTCR